MRADGLGGRGWDEGVVQKVDPGRFIIRELYEYIFYGKRDRIGFGGA